MSSAKWILKRLNSPGEIVLSGQEEYSFGRGKNCYEPALSLLVSRLHCIIRETEKGLVIKDLNSSNGTFINEQRIPANTCCILKVNDIVGFGIGCASTSEHYVYELIKEACEGSNNIVCENLKNEPGKEKKSTSTEISPFIHVSEEEENENDEPLIIEEEIDLIDLIEEEEEEEETDITAAGSSSKSISSSVSSCTNVVDSGVSSSFVVESRKTICIKIEKCGTEDSELCVNDGKRTTELSSDSGDKNKRGNESRLKDIKIESGIETCSVVEQCNLQPKGLNSASGNNQCVVKVVKSSSSNANLENNKIGTVCKSFHKDLLLNNRQGGSVSGINIKEECVNINSASNFCKNNIIHHNEKKQVSSFDTTNRSMSVIDLETSSNNVIVASVKEENVNDCRNKRLIPCASENVNKEDHSCVRKQKSCVSSSSRIESSQILALKRTIDPVHSVPDVSTYESSGPARKKRKSNNKDGDDASNRGSSTSALSKKSSSSSKDRDSASNSGSSTSASKTSSSSSKDSDSASNSGSSTSASKTSSCSSQSQADESDNEDVLYKRFANPILDQIEKINVTKSVIVNRFGINHLKRGSAKNYSFTHVNSKVRRNAHTFILSEMKTLPPYLNPVVILKKLDFKKIQETGQNIKEEAEISFDDDLFEEAVHICMSTPKQGDQINQNSETSESHNTSVINYSQSDDVIVIDDDDFMSDEKSNKRLQVDEDVKEEIFVKQEVFEDDEQVIEDDDDNEMDREWFDKLSQPSNPVIEDQITLHAAGKLKRRRVVVVDSESSDEDPVSEQNISVGNDISNQSPDANSYQTSKILCDDSSKNQGNAYVKISLKSKELLSNSLKDQSKTKNKNVDQNNKTSLSYQTNEDHRSENESDISETQTLNMYAEMLLDNTLSARWKEPSTKNTNYAEGNIAKELHENAKSSKSCDSSRRTLLCSALPMKSKYRSKITSESRDQKKTVGFNSEVTEHHAVNENHFTNLTRGRTISSEHKSKSSSHKEIGSSISEKELKMKVREDRKAKLKALTEQKKDAPTSNTEMRVLSKSSYLVKNTSSSRADKLAESLADSFQSRSSKSRKIKVRVTKKSNSETRSQKSNSETSSQKSNSETRSSAVCENNSSHYYKEPVINPVTSEITAPKQIASESSSGKLDQDIPISEVEMKIKKLSFKDIYKIPKLNQSSSSEPKQQHDSAPNAIVNKYLSKPSELLQKITQSSSLKKLAAPWPKKSVSFAPGDSLCVVRTFMIEPGNTLRRIDGKDVPVRKRLAEQAEVLYDSLTKTLNRVTNAILRNWNPRWMTEQTLILRSGGEPPPAHCQNTPVSTLCPMLTAFSNYEEYLKIVDPLMMLDLWAKVSEDSNKPNQRMKRKYDISVLESKAANGIVTLNCSMPLKSKEEKEGLSLHVGDLCILRYPVWNHSNNGVGHSTVANQQDSYYERFAYIYSLTKDYRSTNNNWNQRNTPGNSRPFSPIYGVMNIVIKLKGDSSLNIINASLRIVSGIRTELRHFEAIGYLEHTKLCDMILNPCVEDYKLPHTDPNERIVSEDHLNAAQRNAVIKGAFVCTHSTPRICLIQGPPGTGKTKVILNIIKQVLYPNGQYSKARFDKKIRILLCAPSNAAADEMAERLLALRTQMSKENRFKMVRTGPLESMRENVRGISLDELAKKDVEQAFQQTQFESIDVEIATLEARKRSFEMSYEHAARNKKSIAMYEKRIQETEKKIADLRSSKKNVSHKSSETEKEAKKKVLGHADIVVTTLNSSYSPQMTEVFASRNEKNRLRFACCIIDEATQCTEPESLIPLMLGIERIILVGDPEQLPATVLSQVAKTKSFGQSLFNRIWNKFQNEADNPIIFLNIQYRMHPEIYHWPNTYIYHGRVKTDPSCNFLCRLKPYTVLAHMFQQHSHTFVNSNEARLVCDIAMAVTQTFPNYVKSVGIITPYQQQLQEIKTCLERSRTNDIAVIVNTIDGFQGRECDVIIFSCVRTRGVGFMGESQRLNVALTRARRSLIICGNFVSLQADKMWSSLLGDAMQRRMLVNHNRIMNQHDILNCLTKYS